MFAHRLDNDEGEKVADKIPVNHKKNRASNERRHRIVAKRKSFDPPYDFKSVADKWLDASRSNEVATGCLHCSLIFTGKSGRIRISLMAFAKDVIGKVSTKI